MPIDSKLLDFFAGQAAQSQAAMDKLMDTAKEEGEKSRAESRAAGIIQQSLRASGQAASDGLQFLTEQQRNGNRAEEKQGIPPPDMTVTSSGMSPRAADAWSRMYVDTRDSRNIQDAIDEARAAEESARQAANKAKGA